MGGCEMFGGLVLLWRVGPFMEGWTFYRGSGNWVCEIVEIFFLQGA